MIRGSVRVEDKDRGWDKLKDELEDQASHVDVGVHPDEEAELIVIASANEFGAVVNHPGGVAYGFQTAEDARRGRVRFLKGGVGFKVLGETGPHTIRIPARPYIRSTIDENQEKYGAVASEMYKRILDGSLSKAEALERMGLLIESDIKAKMVALRNPPNAPSTIRRKGSDNPLIDKGLLLNSIRYVVKTATEE